MFTVHRKEIEWGGRRLILETGKVARQAAGSVVVQYGDTIVLCTATAASSMKPGIDFFPLTVNYQEKTFAAGKIPGGFFKRAPPSERPDLASSTGRSGRCSPRASATRRKSSPRC
jgi:polyribonucleotide nucleotidyltransferase